MENNENNKQQQRRLNEKILAHQHRGM